MLKKFASVLIIFAVLCTGLCACGDDDDTAMVMPIKTDPMCLDPQVVETNSGKLIAESCYEGLVRLDENFKIIPGVAESWEISPDGLTYTFHLRKDSKWKLLNSYEKVLPDKNYKKTFDNRVTAQDFVFGLQRAIDPVTQCSDAEKLYCIKNAKDINTGNEEVSFLGVSAENDTTLVITLERANPDFLRLMTLPAAMPCKKEFFRETHAKYGLEVKYTFCNGPYYLSTWAEDNSLILYKNDDYRGNSKVKPDNIYFYVNKDEESVVSKFKQHSYNCAYVSEAAYRELAEGKSNSFLSAETTVSGICFNCKDDILINEDIRKALIGLTKFNEIEKPVTTDKNAEGIVPGCCRYGEKSYREAAGKVRLPVYNETTALKYWEKGLKEIGADSLEIKIICTEEYTAQMQKIIQNWQIKLSTAIIAKVETLSKADFDTAVLNGNYQIAVGSVSTDSSTAVDILKKFTSDSNSNVFYYNSEKYDKLIDEIILLASGNDILAKYKEAEQMLVDDAVFIPLFTGSKHIAVNNDVTGIYSSPALESIIFLNGGIS